jgi:hypothetical protein
MREGAIRRARDLEIGHKSQGSETKFRIFSFPVQIHFGLSVVLPLLVLLWFRPKSMYIAVNLTDIFRLFRTELLLLRFVTGIIEAKSFARRGSELHA